MFLRDWKISVTGKSKVLEETQKNFEMGGDIKIDVLRTYQDNNTVVAGLHKCKRFRRHLCHRYRDV